MNELFVDRSLPSAQRLRAMTSTMPRIPTMVERFLPVMIFPPTTIRPRQRKGVMSRKIEIVRELKRIVKEV
jgi:hypothetical protein